jgi:hypothetical protein
VRALNIFSLEPYIPLIRKEKKKLQSLLPVGLEKKQKINQKKHKTQKIILSSKKKKKKPSNLNLTRINIEIAKNKKQNTCIDQYCMI